MKKKGMAWLPVLMLAFSGCASVTIKPVDYSWSFESVITTDAAGIVKGDPRTISFDAGELFRAETNTQGTPADKTVRIIRDEDGYYFVTSPGFRNVYIFESAAGKLTLKKKVLIAEEGMEQPYFNRRDEGIELGAEGLLYLLNNKGIVAGGKR